MNSCYPRSQVRTRLRGAVKYCSLPLSSLSATPGIHSTYQSVIDYRYSCTLTHTHMLSVCLTHNCSQVTHTHTHTHTTHTHTLTHSHNTHTLRVLTLTLVTLTLTHTHCVRQELHDTIRGAAYYRSTISPPPSSCVVSSGVNLVLYHTVR